VEGNATDPSVSRIGLVTFSDSAKIEFDLDDYRERTELLQAINVQYSGGTTNTPDAIRYNTTFLLHFHSRADCRLGKKCYIFRTDYMILQTLTVVLSISVFISF